ncbi:unnamed protein product [Pleuronectes platessa]|uniref:Uncharacterized protein n=1 Tax=Pleuronectes platessa TaxID=8262 RepID=A0A9N7VKD5_PLEPL|nr:unnamed protein product [Pleuronectes platessa]
MSRSVIKNEPSPGPWKDKQAVSFWDRCSPKKSVTDSRASGGTDEQVPLPDELSTAPSSETHLCPGLADMGLYTPGRSSVRLRCREEANERISHISNGSVYNATASWLEIYDTFGDLQIDGIRVFSPSPTCGSVGMCRGKLQPEEFLGKVGIRISTIAKKWQTNDEPTRLLIGAHSGSLGGAEEPTHPDPQHQHLKFQREIHFTDTNSSNFLSLSCVCLLNLIRQQNCFYLH